MPSSCASSSTRRKSNTRRWARLLDYYLYSSYQGEHAAAPASDPRATPARATGVIPETDHQPRRRDEWFTDERMVISDLVKNSFEPYHWSLAITMQQFYHREACCTTGGDPCPPASPRRQRRVTTPAGR